MRPVTLTTTYKDEKIEEGTKRTGKVSLGSSGSFGTGAVIDYAIETGIRLEKIEEK